MCCGYNDVISILKKKLSQLFLENVFKEKISIQIMTKKERIAIMVLKFISEKFVLLNWQTDLNALY